MILMFEKDFSPKNALKLNLIGVPKTPSKTGTSEHALSLTKKYITLN